MMIVCAKLCIYCTAVGVHHLYSEQKNWFMLGQFFLGRQVATQGTKLNPWEFSTGWPSTFPLCGPNSINS